MSDGARSRIQEYRFEDDGRIPNNPALPLLVYPGALGEPERDPSRCKKKLAENGWGGAWVTVSSPTTTTTRPLTRSCAW